MARMDWTDLLVGDRLKPGGQGINRGAEKRDRGTGRKLVDQRSVLAFVGVVALAVMVTAALYLLG
jgi:hypothetical protein